MLYVMIIFYKKTFDDPQVKEYIAPRRTNLDTRNLAAMITAIAILTTFILPYIYVATNGTEV